MLKAGIIKFIGAGLAIVIIIYGIGPGPSEVVDIIPSKITGFRPDTLISITFDILIVGGVFQMKGRIVQRIISQWDSYTNSDNILPSDSISRVSSTETLNNIEPTNGQEHQNADDVTVVNGAFPSNQELLDFLLEMLSHPLTEAMALNFLFMGLFTILATYYRKYFP